MTQRQESAQTMVEYMILLAVVVAIILVGIKNYLPRVNTASNIYFNRVSKGVMGPQGRCGDGYCCCYENIEKCPLDCPSSPASGPPCDQVCEL